MIELHTSHTQDRENRQFLLIEISMLKEKIRCHSMFKLAHHINGSAWLNLSHHIFSNHLSFPSFFLVYRKCFYISSIFASYYNTHIEWKLNFFKKQTIGHKRSIEYQVKEQDTLRTYEKRPLCRLTFGKRQNSLSHSNNGKIL